MLDESEFKKTVKHDRDVLQVSDIGEHTVFVEIYDNVEKPSAVYARLEAETGYTTLLQRQCGAVFERPVGESDD